MQMYSFENSLTQIMCRGDELICMSHLRTNLILLFVVIVEMWWFYLFSPFLDSELELSNEATVLQSGEARCR